MHIKLKRSPGIYLAGFMGSGKSTVGRLLADQLGWDFTDIDTDIEAAEHCTIREIFDRRGELEFRRIETETIGKRVKKVENGMPTVIALGGGAFIIPANFTLIREHGISIWLDCSFDSIQERLAGEIEQRPLAKDPVRLRQLFDDRQPGYSRADFRVDANTSAPHIVTSILDLPLWK